MPSGQSHPSEVHLLMCPGVGSPGRGATAAQSSSSAQGLRLAVAMAQSQAPSAFSSAAARCHHKPVQQLHSWHQPLSSSLGPNNWKIGVLRPGSFHKPCSSMCHVG